MGILDRIKGAARAMAGPIGQASGSLARVGVPGTATAELPAGPAALYWDDTRSTYPTKGTGSRVTIDFEPPADLTVSMRSLSGEDVAWEPEDGSAYLESVRISGNTGKAKLARCRIGTVTIPAAGSYEIEVSATLAPEFERAELLLDPA
jgi:hypothetical protein